MISYTLTLNVDVQQSRYLKTKKQVTLFARYEQTGSLVFIC